VVDDFGVKYIGETHANRLIGILKKSDGISGDWKGNKYCGLSLDWDYDKQEVYLSMPGYVEKALACFKHERPKQLQDQPHQHMILMYGAKVQYTKPEDDSRELDKNGKQMFNRLLVPFCYMEGQWMV